MRKISSYLYPNRIDLLADLAGFTVEYTNVYQRNVKIYSGIDNVIEFDIKNADQKRIDLNAVSTIELNVMDASGLALPNSPYVVTPIAGLKGIAKSVIPADDLDQLDDQFLRYSVTAVKDGDDVMLYADTRFGATGTIELIGNAMPIIRNVIEYKTYSGEIDLNGNVINHFSSMPVTFYEAVPTQSVDVHIYITGFIGTVWIQGVTSGTISVESFRHSTKIRTQTLSTPTTTVIEFNDITVGDLKYLRVSFQGDNPLNPTGTVDKVILI